MKKQILALMMSLFAITANAGNEGPQAAPTQPAFLIAQTVSSGGFRTPDNLPRSVVLKVYSDGSVYQTLNFQDRTEVKEVAVLSVEVSKKLNSLVASVKPGERVDPNPQSPGCMDAPSYIYSAFPTVQTEVELWARIGCKDFKKSNESEADRQIQRVLKSLETLANLK